jgi:phosphoribosyl 1,2-cyclic phosphodiesterase
MATIAAMGNEKQLRLKFWGVRGSVPVPAADYLEYGGNTTSIEINTAHGVIIIDAGTGIRRLGMKLQEEADGAPLKLNLLLTHFHWDHIQGLPFFTPLYSPQNDIAFYAGYPPAKLQDILEGEMATPYFPVNFEFLPARRKFVDLNIRPLEIAGIDVHPFPMNHPQGAVGFRFEAGHKVIVHASDLEHGNAAFEQTLRKYAQGADVLIYDAQYTPEEYETKQGWGHSTWQEAARIANECKVKQLILFHHDPGHNDAMMKEIVTQACAHFANTDAAREGMEINL